MFVQIIEGKTKDAAGLRQRLEAWQKEVMPGAIGYLGSTGGVTDDGRVFLLARFESADKARKNSGRPEQDSWWAGTEKLFDGTPKFRDSEDVETFLDGGSDTAGFVQIMQGKALDRAGNAATEKQMTDRMSELRPDLIGSVRAWTPGDEFAEVIYFTSEAEARKGEAAEMPADVKKSVEGWEKSIQGLRFTDLKEPWLISP